MGKLALSSASISLTRGESSEGLGLFAPSFPSIHLYQENSLYGITIVWLTTALCIFGLWRLRKGLLDFELPGQLFLFGK